MYKVYDYGRNTKIVNVVDEKGGLVALAETRAIAEYMVGILNQETAPLHEEIERLKAENKAQRSIIKKLNDDLWTSEKAQEGLMPVLEYRHQVENLRSNLKTIIDNIAAGRWTLDKVRRYAIEVMQGIEKKEGE